MSEIEDLYQEVILDHNKSPRNFRKLEGADRTLEGYNPLCGDRLRVYVKLDGDVLRDVSFLGSGCAISKASASVMTESVKGRSRSEIEEMFGRFHRMVTEGLEDGADPLELGEMGALSGVSRFPVRVKCATLAWHTVRAALAGKGETISTE